jgi:hypothetical protein
MNDKIIKDETKYFNNSLLNSPITSNRQRKQNRIKNDQENGLNINMASFQ